MLDWLRNPFTDRNPNPNQSQVEQLNEELKAQHVEYIAHCDDGAGDPTACHSYGEWLASVDKNYTDATQVYLKNCHEKKYGASCFNLGRFYLSGKGVKEPSDALALDAFQHSCEYKHIQGCHHLAVMFANGMGTNKNRTKALKAYEEACDLGNPRSCAQLASIYLSQTKDRDPARAEKYYQVACSANYAPACHDLAVMYKHGDAPVVKDEAKYRHYSAKTQDLINRTGMINSKASVQKS